MIGRLTFSLAEEPWIGGIMLTTTQKKSRNTLFIRLSFCCSTIVLFCPGAPMPWLLLSYQWTMLTVKTLMFHSQCIIWLLWQKWGSIKQSYVSPLERFSTLCHALQAVTTMAKSLCFVLCACVEFQHSSLHRFGRSVDLHYLVKIKGVHWLFWYSLQQAPRVKLQLGVNGALSNFATWWC
jgi:hypothetical protein